MSEEQQSPERGARSQMEVYFPGEPVIDFDALAQFINGCDPDEQDRCEAEAAVDPADYAGGNLAGENVRLSGGLLRLGDFTAFLLGHNVPTPNPECVNNPQLSAELKTKLGAHKGFVLVSLFGGDEYTPLDRMIFLLKIAIGLCKQGALGMGIPAFGTAFPAGLLQQLISTPGMPFWKVMREEREPMQVLSSIGVASHEGSDWLVTRGHIFYGIPDLAFRLSERKQAKKIAEGFQSMISYMLVEGPVIAAGHTMGIDENVAFRFSAPGPNEQFLVGDNPVLIVTLGDNKKRGLLSRIFGR